MLDLPAHQAQQAQLDLKEKPEIREKLVLLVKPDLKDLLVKTAHLVHLARKEQRATTELQEPLADQDTTELREKLELMAHLV